MKKFICLALSIIMAICLISPIGSLANDYSHIDMQLDYKDMVEADSQKETRLYEYTAEKKRYLFNNK